MWRSDPATLFISLGFEIREKYGYVNKFFIDEKRNEFYKNITVDSTLSRSLLSFFDSDCKLEYSRIKIFKTYNEALNCFGKFTTPVIPDEQLKFDRNNFEIYLYRVKAADLSRLLQTIYFKDNNDKLSLSETIEDNFVMVGYDVATFDAQYCHWNSELCNEGLDIKYIEGKYGKLNNNLLFDDLESAESFLKNLDYTDSDDGQTIIVQICSKKI